MLFCDVNVFVGAERNEQPSEQRTRSWLQDALAGHEAVGVAPMVLSSMVRIVTNPRIYERPTLPAEAVQFAEAVLATPAATIVRPGARHWSIFADLVTTQRLRANDVPDAYLAAIALEAGATMVTADRGFARYGLRLVDPLGVGK